MPLIGRTLQKHLTLINKLRDTKAINARTFTTYIKRLRQAYGRAYAEVSIYKASLADINKALRVKKPLSITELRTYIPTQFYDLFLLFL